MKLTDWFNDRTGYRKLVHLMLHEPIPGGARWTFIWGSTLVFVFALQIITGIMLMTVYSPSATTAWSSVWYIQTQMPLGWLVRSLHHFGSQAMIILLPIHVLQVVIAKAYRAPREVNWWLGLALLGITFGLALTGYLLPWDQKGYWATKVATNIMSLAPVVGAWLQKLVVGGSEYGHLTLSRFFTLHIMILPGLFILFLIGHLAMFRRHGVTVANQDAEGEGYFWPDQFLKDSIGCLVVLVAIVGVAGYVHYVLGHQLLDAPADPAASDYPARPEWYYLFLFQFLKYFEGPQMEMVGALLVPAAVGLVLFLIPLFDKILWNWLAHLLTLVIVFGLLGGAGWLTYQAFQDDRNPPDQTVVAVQEKQKQGERLTHADLSILRAHQFNHQRKEATRVAERVLALVAEHGIPPSGPLDLVANDALVRGPQLYAVNCAACHRIDGHDGMGRVPMEIATSSDLAGFAGRAWIRSLLDKPMSDQHFGLMKNKDGEPAHTKMSKWIEQTLEEHGSPAARAALLADFDAVAAYLEDESINPGRLADVSTTAPSSKPTTQPAGALQGEALIRHGRTVFMNTCNECHSYKSQRSGTTKAPEMFGYGSVEWIEKIITDPGHESLYRSTGKEHAQMPAFKDKLSERDRRLIAQWLHQTRLLTP